MATTNVARFRRIYVWEFPVRLYHWVNAICVFVLIATGYLIGNPLAIEYASEAYQQYWFGWVRFLHFMTAYIFFFNFLLRIYWGFVGNRYSNWKNFFPLTREKRKQIREILRVDVLQTVGAGRIPVGHNALAGWVYLLSFLVFLFQAFTGFALYSGLSYSFVPGLFAWVVPLMGGDMAVRYWHHVFMWFFVIFTIVHVYLVCYHDYVEGRGTTSSMVGGWKFERDEEFE
jgi:Ni/Fe-hydrogenase 1 B-type cytochrome subunit